MHDNKARPVETTLTSLQIVREIKQQSGASMTEIAEELDLGKSTVHNHLATLTKEGLLVRQNQRYFVGLGFLQLGEYARNRREAYKPAKMKVYRLAESTNEEVNFAVAENGFMFSIEYMMGDPSPANPVAGSQFLEIGSRFHMHNSAPGKAVLSELPPDEVEGILQLRGLPATTDDTITEKDAFLSELETIRDQEYATNDEELERGFRSIGAPIHHPDGTVLGALSIGGPAYRFQIDSSAESGSIAALLAAVERVENEITQIATSQGRQFE
jgi:IclR family acetate operon transcriptional repressor